MMNNTQKARFVKEIVVDQSHLDEMNHVNNVIYLSFLQSAAIDHWYSVASQNEINSIRWIAKRHEIEYFLPAFEHEKLKIKTWIESFNAVSTNRFYEIFRDEDLVVKANTTWIALDAQTHKPKRLAKSTLLKFTGE